MIRHAALFRLKHESGSDAEAAFVSKIRELASIPGVNDFALSRETSPKNPYDFAVSMTFADQLAYDTYNVHPLHAFFVQNRWIPEVAEFMEHDSVAI